MRKKQAPLLRLKNSRKTSKALVQRSSSWANFLHAGRSPARSIPRRTERLQDQIEPFPYEEVERIVSGELGVRISKAFADFDPAPLAAASLAQVHRAYMRDGRAVVVKVQRPDIRELIVGDLEALGEIAHFLDDHTELGKRYEFENMLVNLRKSLLRELDFTIEANNLHTLAQNLAEFDQHRYSGAD